MKQDLLIGNRYFQVLLFYGIRQIPEASSLLRLHQKPVCKRAVGIIIRPDTVYNKGNGAVCIPGIVHHLPERGILPGKEPFIRVGAAAFLIAAVLSELLRSHRKAGRHHLFINVGRDSVLLRLYIFPVINPVQIFRISSTLLLFQSVTSSL